MNKPHVFFLAAAVSVVSSSVAHAADDFTIVPSIAYQQKQLSFDQKFKEPGTNLNGHKADFDVSIPTANFTLTGIYQKFYASLKYEDSLTEATTEVDETQTAFESTNSPNAPLGHYLNTGLGDKTEVERRDYSLTVGANVWENLNVFAGYMRGETSLLPQASCVTACDFNAVHNLAAEQQFGGLPHYEQEYIEEGPYIGASYGWRLADVGTLSASLAYAQMDGVYQDNYQLFAGQAFKFEGDSTGLSLGLTWSAPLTDRVGYFVDLRRQAYSMEGDTNNPTWAGVEVKTNEVMLGLTAGIQWYF